jgi:hypothetical protein
MCSPVRGGGDLANLDDYARAYLQWMQRVLPQAQLPKEGRQDG